jgi:hypothetical protein
MGAHHGLGGDLQRLIVAAIFGLGRVRAERHQALECRGLDHQLDDDPAEGIAAGDVAVLPQGRSR